MNRREKVSMAACAVFVLAVASASAKCELARKGRALMPVVIATNASVQTRLVAEELTNYLYRISEAQFTITNGDEQTRGLALGSVAEFPGVLSDASVSKGLVISNDCDGKESFIIKNRQANGVWLIAATSNSVSYAATTFLESFGCRWLAPAPEWEIVPSVPQLTYQGPSLIVERPFFYERMLFAYGGIVGADVGHVLRSTDEFGHWMRRNRLNTMVYNDWAKSRYCPLNTRGSFMADCGQGYNLSVVAAFTNEFAQHPEYYAWVVTNQVEFQQSGYPHGGTRKPSRLEVGNTNVQQMVISWATNFFAHHPEADSLSMESEDGGGPGSSSPEALAIGNDSDQVCFMANLVARELQKSYPGKWVGFLSYDSHYHGPHIPLESNVCPVLAMYGANVENFHSGDYKRSRQMSEWAAKAQRLGLFEYYSNWHIDHERIGGDYCQVQRMANSAYLTQSFREFATRGNFRAMIGEVDYAWGALGRGYYLTSKLLWNPQADAKAVLMDYYQKGFGPAAGVMQQYYELQDPQDKGYLFSKNVMAQAYRLLESASRKAGTDPAIQARLDHEKQFLYFNYLFWREQRAATTDEEKALNLELITWAWRTRYTHMVDWTWIHVNWLWYCKDRYGVPTWDASNANAPWRVSAPITRAEMDAKFQEGLNYFQPQPVTQTTYSPDLVPVNFPYSPSILTQNATAGGKLWALYCTNANGGALEFDLLPVFAYGTPADFQYTVSNSKGAIVTQATLQQDGQWRHLSVPVPAGGVYYLDVDDACQAWWLRVTNDVSACFAPRKEGWSTYGVPDLYFYVPKGTTHIQYYYNLDPAHRNDTRNRLLTTHELYRPDGVLSQTVSNWEEVVDIPVPPGQDGACWRLHGLKLGQLWLYNVPNYLAMSPNALLIPREVAKRDGLRLR